MSAAEAFRIARENKHYDKAIELVPYAHFLGITFSENGSDLLFRLPYDRSIIGNSILPAIHGGVIAGFMENAAIMHLMWTSASLDVPKNIDFTIDYLLSGKSQDTYALCRVTKLGKRVANVHIEAWQNDRNLPIAVARSHFKLISR